MIDSFMDVTLSHEGVFNLLISKGLLVYALHSDKLAHHILGDFRTREYFT